MTLDESLVIEVDRAAAKQGTSRSAFTRDALRHALAREKEKRLEEKHRLGYLKKPVTENEFGNWESLQAWGEP
jgi:metal-responsive CopG/Arc/MetJ family transcriptional regulator